MECLRWRDNGQGLMRSEMGEIGSGPETDPDFGRKGLNSWKHCCLMCLL